MRTTDPNACSAQSTRSDLCYGSGWDLIVRVGRWIYLARANILVVQIMGCDPPRAFAVLSSDNKKCLYPPNEAAPGHLRP